MTDEKRPVKLQHNVIMESRKHLTVTGVADIDSFDEQTVIVFTDLGELTIKGRELHINKIDMETGDLVMEGAIESLAYTENLPQKSGLFAKLFR